jgi:predicted DNA-binding protein
LRKLFEENDMSRDRRVHLRLNDREAEQLARLAASLRRSMAAIMREALDEYALRMVGKVLLSEEPVKRTRDGRRTFRR